MSEWSRICECICAHVSLVGFHERTREREKRECTGKDRVIYPSSVCRICEHEQGSRVLFFHVVLLFLLFLHIYEIVRSPFFWYFI